MECVGVDYKKSSPRMVVDPVLLAFEARYLFAFKASEISIALLVLYCTSTAYRIWPGSQTRIDIQAEPHVLSLVLNERTSSRPTSSRMHLRASTKWGGGCLKSAELPSTSSSSTIYHNCRTPIIETKHSYSPMKKHAGGKS